MGYKFEYWRDKSLTLNVVQVNHLLKRWNRPDSQANMYLMSGMGFAYSDADGVDERTSAAGFIGMATDWEDRRYFISYQNRYTDALGIDDDFQQSARFGWAPYVGDYGDLHTWLMLQIEHQPEAENTFTVTPLLRFFKNIHLLEAGVNERGEFLLNYIFRY